MDMVKCVLFFFSKYDFRVPINFGQTFLNSYSYSNTIFKKTPITSQHW